MSALARPCPGGARAWTESSAPYVSQVKGCCVLATSCTGWPRCGVPNASANQLALGAQRRPDDSSRSCNLRHPRRLYPPQICPIHSLVRHAGEPPPRRPCDQGNAQGREPSATQTVALYAGTRARTTHTHARTHTAAQCAYGTRQPPSLCRAPRAGRGCQEFARAARRSFKWGAPFVFFLEKRKLTNSVQMLTAWLD